MVFRCCWVLLRRSHVAKVGVVVASFAAVYSNSGTNEIQAMEALSSKSGGNGIQAMTALSSYSGTFEN